MFCTFTKLENDWPKRYSMMALLLFALLLCFVDRVLISIAGIEMQKELGWTDSDKGLVFSTFFLGYLCMQLLGGIFANRFGGRNVFLIAVLVWSLMTVITPAAAYSGIALLVVSRFLLGIGEGAAYPSSYGLIHDWMPPGEVSRSVGLIVAAGSVGTVVALAVVGKMIELWGWPSVFYFFGSIGVVWCVFWWAVVPAVAPQSGGHQSETAVGQVPWKSFVMCRRVFPLYAAFIAFGCVFFTLANWLPSYFVDTFQLTLTQAGVYSIIPWIANGIVNVWSGFLADRWIREGRDRLKVRKRLLTLGLAGTALGCLLLPITSSPLQSVLVVTFLFGAIGATVPGFVPLPAELFPRHGPILYGFMSASGSASGAVVVALTGILLDITGTYTAVFGTLAALCVLGIVIFQTLDSTKPVLLEDREAADEPI